MMPKTKAARMFVAKGFLCVARQQAGIFDTLRHKKDITESASSPLVALHKLCCLGKQGGGGGGSPNNYLLIDPS